ncbi:hypothetical protein H2203_000033 [Taxawa tesnikishii (nom. ined.)]|nr:hypothetical protein H2203_000033 [Dothideales sp. JES 119]
MAPQSSPGALSALRAASFRLYSTPTAELPHAVPYIAQSLAACKDLLSDPESLNQKDGDVAVILHRYQTQLSTLLQDRTADGRWAAVVLVKATIEAGGWATLSKSLAWVRGLLGILKKPDPSTTKCLCIITLTRIFMLTWDYPTLIREITTPSLPAFITICLNNMAGRLNAADEYHATLESFTRLLPRHPTIFRNHQNQITATLSTLMAGSTSPTSKQAYNSPRTQDLAQRLFVLIPQCEPKQGAGPKWEHNFMSVLNDCHKHANRALVSVTEDWQSVTGHAPGKTGDRKEHEKAQQDSRASRRLAFDFVYAGSEILTNDLRLLRSHIMTETSTPVSFPLGPLADLLTRIFSVVASSDAAKSSIRFNQDASREERDALVEVLPVIHVAALELLYSVLERFSRAIVSTAQTFLDQIIWVFRAELSNVHIRASVYRVTQKLTNLVGPSFTKEVVASLSPVIKACCNDLLAGDGQQQQQQRTNEGKSGSMKTGQTIANADAFLSTRATPLTTKTAYVGLHQAALALLPVLFLEALIAAVLNPPARQGSTSQGSSLLPFLARQFPQNAAVESLLRPRMPVLQTGRKGTLGSAPPDEEEEEEVDEPEQDIQMQDHSPPPREHTHAGESTEDVSHMEQGLIDAALASYLSTHPEARRSRDAVDGPDSLVDPRRVSPEQQHAHAVAGRERQAQEEDLPGQSAVEGAQGTVTQPKKDEDMPSAATIPSGPAASAAGDPRSQEEDGSEGDDFIIPQIHMGDDSEDEDEDDDEEERD